MSFTNLALVRKHISEHHIGTAQFENIPIHLTGTAPIQLPNVNILFDSEKVKAKEMIAPISENIVFSSDTVNLAHSEIIPDSVVLAKDSSLGQIYIENVDFSINYDEGKVSRISDGSISSGASVVIWYFYYCLYQRDTDYKINYSSGEMTRLGSGTIEDGQWILVDYTVEYGSINDDIIENAILEASGVITNFIDPAYIDSTDQGLVTAETYLAVSTVCHIKSMDVLNQNVSGSNAQAFSRSWSQIAEVYEKKGYLILNNYAKTKTGLKSPEAISSEN